MVGKKGQLKIQQMAFMLIAVTIFFAMIGMIVLLMWTSGLKSKATDYQQEQALLLVSKLANAPEFACGKYFGNERINCVDLDKLILVKDRKNDYKNFWGISNVEVRIIYPDEDEILCTQDNYPNCNVINLMDEELAASESNFVAACKKVKEGTKTFDKCEIGIMSLAYEAK
jgi:hypothetical protein